VWCRVQLREKRAFSTVVMVKSAFGDRAIDDSERICSIICIVDIGS